MKRFTGIFSLVLAAGLASEILAAPVLFIVPLDGSQVVPGPGDPDGTGRIYLAVDLERMTLDWHTRVYDVDFPMIGASIRRAPAGAVGPVVVDFGDQLNGAGLSDADLAAIVANPTDHYVSVNNYQFPAGAVRGQLGHPIPEPSTISLLVLGLVSLGLPRRRAAGRR
jgi:hypothetical protein